jgi:large subunit ribosomal protein L11
MQIKLLVEGGAMAPGPALSQKLGPAGINLGQVISKVNDATKDFKGLKVPVELDVDMNTKDFTVNVFSPPVSELLKKELGVEKGSGMQLKENVANASIEQIISIAKQKMQNLLAKDLKAAVKSVLGTCTSLGVLVENKSAVEVGQDVDQGKYDKEIQEEKTETSPEKKAELDRYFTEVHGKQEKLIKAEEAAKAEAEAEAAAAAPAAPGTEPAEPGAAPAPTAPAEPGAAPAESNNNK